MQIVGTIKDTIGSLTGNESQQAEGKAQNVRILLFTSCGTLKCAYKLSTIMQDVHAVSSKVAHIISGQSCSIPC